MREDLPAIVTEAVGDAAGRWDLAGEIPLDLLRGLAGKGLLCPEIGTQFGGLGLTGRECGELTAHVGSLCSSLRSVMTSQQMGAWTISRLGDRTQREHYLSRLTGGELVAVAFSEPDAGSDLSAMSTLIREDGDTLVVDGVKTWITASVYADLLVVFGRYGDGGAAVIIPATSPGVRRDPARSPMGCRAAGHATVTLDAVRVPRTNLLGAAGQSLAMLTTIALTCGRLSVAWGCVGILRACLAAATAHARDRRQFGVPIAKHQLVARHLAELYVAERTATLACERASDCWDEGSPDQFTAAVLAKLVASRAAAQGAATAVQVLASAGAQDGHVVARAYRDAKLMEIIEGSSEVSQMILADRVMGVGR
ncbi:acyl-CoA dehydrogenase family protein [Streptomyces sp. ISL-10]|uniref:acyl-CoA dehydrogenase family protein n=1 Tax=Streptomyces sp. ISL-10 TaxID=2819172 RepID=UPI001BECAD4A|nr:acyl-CoA dehydrogenase family protein [Streptomyces sp. ISL-10]MBT2370333.1 acyl-CoA dehydrogenase family protein [Streptomyces sp. ISL-10]